MPNAIEFSKPCICDQRKFGWRYEPSISVGLISIENQHVIKSRLPMLHITWLKLRIAEGVNRWQSAASWFGYLIPWRKNSDWVRAGNSKKCWDKSVLPRHDKSGIVQVGLENTAKKLSSRRR